MSDDVESDGGVSDQEQSDRGPRDDGVNDREHRDREPGDDGVRDREQSDREQSDREPGDRQRGDDGDAASESDKKRAEAYLAGSELDPDDAADLERRSRKRGQVELAERVRERRVKIDRAQAQAFLKGAQLDTRAARRLELRLAKVGDQELASQLRPLRAELDRRRALVMLGATAGNPEELLQLAMSLRQYRDFGTARRLLTLSCESITRGEHPRIYAKTFQQAALATYKDPDLPLEWKLERAYQLLTKTENLEACDVPETLGLAGAIFKRRWELDGRRQNLERALFFYLKGYAQGAPREHRADVLAYLAGNPGVALDASQDQGYTGINAAFVLDLLAAQEEEEARRVGIASTTAKARREQARLIRSELTRSVPPLLERDDFGWLEEQWWFYATLGEAYFGLGEYELALEWLIKRPQSARLQVGFGVRSSAGLQVPEWEYESTARQLAKLARLQCESARTRPADQPEVSDSEFEASPGAQALERFLVGDHRAVLSAFRGKFGLGLSGGGFRAALFHIGVLARLAEIDALRHVEVLSCVSGGSIVGAYYYLELRKLLHTKADSEIVRADYIEIVKRLETKFLRGVQRNIRTRVLAEFTTNLKMLFRARYSRTLRVGELYERELYSQIDDAVDVATPQTGPSGVADSLPRAADRRRKPRLLEDLRIFPLQEADALGRREQQRDFHPRRDNWRRNNKVPIMVLNACSLNTGHNWQFTASYMGEPPDAIQAAVDSNYRLRRFYFDDSAPTRSAPVTLGQAVAASSCVPGLFEPIILDGLYTDDPKRSISVRLVDGGVCDNQGIASLLEQDCSVMLVSDGSGQMEAEDEPSAGILGVPLRSNSILQARVRAAEYEDIAARRRAKVLRGLMYVHLKQDLGSRALAWRDCPPYEKQCDLYDSNFDARAEQLGVTSYGVMRDVQRKLAAVRTDLDSFCDAEAYALMASGYRTTVAQFRGRASNVSGFPDAPRERWNFLTVDEAMTAGRHYPRFEKLLDVAKNTAFKIWRLEPALVFLKWALAAVVALGLVAVFAAHWSELLLPDWLRSWLTSKLTFEWVAVSLGSLAAAALFAFVINCILGKARGETALKVIHWRDTLKDIAIGGAMCLLGWLIARVHLHVFDPLYLRYGKVKNVVE